VERSAVHSFPGLAPAMRRLFRAKCSETTNSAHICRFAPVPFWNGFYLLSQDDTAPLIFFDLVLFSDTSRGKVEMSPAGHYRFEYTGA
jgi:hypothetical protein